MPTGHYKRSPELLEKIKENFKKGREPGARQKANEAIREIAKSEEWRQRVSEGTRLAMSREEVRQKRRETAKKHYEIHGSNFKGGNGQPPVAIVQRCKEVWESFGFVMELVIHTKGHTTHHEARSHYTADFGHPEFKIAIEYDGPSHYSRESRESDRKKDEILESLGWAVIRIPHD